MKRGGGERGYGVGDAVWAWEWWFVESGRLLEVTLYILLKTKKFNSHGRKSF